jgi:plastocyanin
MRRLSAAILTVGALALALAACGGSSSGGASTGDVSSPSSSGSSTTTSAAPASAIPKGALEIAASSAGQLMFDKSSLTAPKAGRVTIAFTNLSPLDHNLTVEDPATKKVLGATQTFQGTTKLLKLDLKPGTYKYFCSVPGHRSAGMEGTLTVK